MKISVIFLVISDNNAALQDFSKTRNDSDKNLPIGLAKPPMDYLLSAGLINATDRLPSLPLQSYRWDYESYRRVFLLPFATCIEFGSFQCGTFSFSIINFSFHLLIPITSPFIQQNTNCRKPKIKLLQQQ